jgi:hypothetical protein
MNLVVSNFGFSAGGWRVERHPRFLADLTGDGRADIVGFGDGGVWVSLNNGNGGFTQTVVRRNIWGLESTTAWDPVTLAYAKAVKVLQGRPLTDPTSWTYQAAIHGRSGAVPPGALWNECQHGSWYFLPWHRMYLYEFERIIRKEVVAQGGPEDWALPYWDYDEPGQAQLPPAFRQPTMPDGTPNPLFVTARGPGWNAGAQVPPSAASSAIAMATIPFAPPPAPGFGGGKTTPQHLFGLTGELEFTPHNDVHGLIGGMMGLVDQAALDPIFWLHHANIDRLWAVWLGRGAGRADPPDTAWRNQVFALHDETGAKVQLTAAEVLDTAGQLGYTYEDVAEAAVLPAMAAEGMTAPPPAGSEPEMVGASERPVQLTGEPVSVEIAIDQRVVRDRAREEAADAGRRVYLNIEDVEADRNPALVYEVFVSVPGSGGTSYYVGNVSFFGIEHMTGGAEAGAEPHGFRRTFDITGPVERLREQGLWNDEQVSVSLRPLAAIPPPGELSDAEGQELAEAQAVPVRVGRISVFYG